MTDEDDDTEIDDTEDEDDDDEVQAFPVPTVESLIAEMGGRVWFGDDDRGREEQHYVEVPSRAAALEQIEDALTREPPRSTAVIAEDGAGKTALIREAARRLHEQGAVVFEATSTDVIAGQSYIGQLEGRIQALAAASRGKPIAWVLPDPQDAIGAGAWRGDPAGLLDRMLPYVQRGELQLLVEATPAVWQALAQLKPAVAQALEPIRLEPLSDEDTLAVARGWLARRGAAMEERALAEAHEVAGEHLSASVPPGDLLRLLRATYERLVRERGRPERIGREDVLVTLGELSGMPVALIDEERRLDLERLRGFFEQRVLGQPEAVQLLVERIAMVKAGLTDPTRPLGVFLFVGPTGTGKTELAKALADYLFGSEKRLIRLDMSEFQTPDSLERLLAGPQSDEGADFLPAIRRRPFSVVLLDEFEKAHPRIWDAFLQVFDDARLTDRRGGTADFRHCVVIMTSNLGAGAARSAPVGFTTTTGSGEPGARSYERSVADAFRPEFVNRIDRIVSFRPLARDVMRLLVRKELQAVTRRRGLRTRPWSVEWDESAIEFLLERGFTPDLGARPLKRAVEDHVLAPLARGIVEHEVPRGDQFLFVRARDGERITVEFIDPDADAPPADEEPPPAEPRRADLAGIALDPTGGADDVAALQAAFATVSARLADEGWRDRKQALLERMAEPAFWEDPDRFAQLGTAEYLDRIEAGLAGAERLLRRLEQATRRGDRSPARLARLVAQRLHLLRVALDALAAGDPADAFVLVRPNGADDASRDLAARIAAMYRGWAEQRGMRLDEVADGAGAHRFAVSGFGAFSVLRPESGLHVLERPARAHGFDRCAVTVTVAAQPPQPAPDAATLRALADSALGATAPSSRVVRRYREEPSPLVRDAVRGWRTGRLDRVLGGDFDLFA